MTQFRPPMKLGRRLAWHIQAVEDWIEVKIAIAKVETEKYKEFIQAPPKRRGRPTKTEEIKRRKEEEVVMSVLNKLSQLGFQCGQLESRFGFDSSCLYFRLSLFKENACSKLRHRKSLSLAIGQNPRKKYLKQGEKEAKAEQEALERLERLMGLQEKAEEMRRRTERKKPRERQENG